MRGSHRCARQRSRSSLSPSWRPATSLFETRFLISMVQVALYTSLGPRVRHLLTRSVPGPAPCWAQHEASGPASKSTGTSVWREGGRLQRVAWEAARSRV